MLRHHFRAAAVTALAVFAATTQAQTSTSAPNIYGMLPLTTTPQQSSNSTYNPVTAGSPTNGAGAMSGSNNPIIQHFTRKSNGEPLITTSQGTNSLSSPQTNTATTKTSEREKSTSQTTTPSTNCNNSCQGSMLSRGCNNNQLLQELVMLEAINTELLQLLIAQMMGNGSQIGEQGLNSPNNGLSLLNSGGTGSGLASFGGPNGLSGISGQSNGSQMLQQMMGGHNRSHNTNGMTGSSGSMGNSQMMQQMMSAGGMPTGMTGMNSMYSPTAMTSRGGSSGQQQMMAMLMSKMHGKNGKTSGTTSKIKP